MKIRVADDISPGDWITPWRDLRRDSQQFESKKIRCTSELEEFMQSKSTARTPPPVREGVPLKVLGVSLPFVLCSVLCPGGTEAGPEIIDVRHHKVVRLDVSYVQAVKDFKKPDQSEEELNGVEQIPF